MLPCTFPQANLGKMALRVVLRPLGLCVMCYHCSISPSRVKIREKVGVSGLESTATLDLDRTVIV
jgi:hypothetical protein